MNTPKSLLVIGLMVLLAATSTSCGKRSGTRSVGPASPTGGSPPGTFSREASAGLFVGVRDFPHDDTLEVPYAVDDAVDLAYRFSLDQRVGLIPPRRVVLALSGWPQKDESRRRLYDLQQAGARILRTATAGDILELLKKQSAAAGDSGLFVLSLASHGFQQNGDAYILGSTSAFGSPETSLRAATIFDVASRARRSLILMDACRDRLDARGAGSDPAAAAPHLRRMNGVQGQVILYAAAPGEYAYDDDMHQNGVFTKAVLDGLNCQASAPHGTVVVETLHQYVEREVRRWIFENKHRTVDPATQVSMEGKTCNMPLCECWRAPGPRIRVAVDRTIVTAYSDDTRPLWREDFGRPVVGAIAADLYGDSFYEVIVGLPERVVALDRDGKTLWSQSGEEKTLRTFTTGDLFEKHRTQVIALWGSDHGSRLSVLDIDGSERSSLDYAGQLQRVAVGRPTNRHAPKIVVASSNNLMLFHVKKLDRGLPVWRQVLRSTSAAIKDLRIVEPDSGAPRCIAVTTASGTTWFTFDGDVLRQSAKGTWEKTR